MKSQGGLMVDCYSRSQHTVRLIELGRAFGRILKIQDSTLSLMLVRDSKIRILKRQYFGIDAATDVLSFPAGETPFPGPRSLGDIVISLDTARRNARDFGHALEHELALYLAHGLLHLLGHDHRTPMEARAMARLERKLLAGPGMLARSDEI